MIRFVRLYAWLRWRLLANGLRNERRDALERASRVLQVMMPVALSALFVGSVAAVAILGFLAGHAAAGPAAGARGTALVALRVGLFLAVGLIVFVPLAGATTGVSTEYRRLLLLPISRRQLHAVEVLASALDPWSITVLVVPLAVAVGLATAHRAAAALVAVVAAAAFAAVLVSLGALSGFLVQWLLRSRRRSEAFVLAFVLVLASLGWLPLLVGDGGPGARRARSTARAQQVTRLEDSDRRLPAWTRALPSELYVEAVETALAGGVGGAWGVVLALGAEGVLVLAVSSRVHRSLLDAVATERRTRRTHANAIRRRRLPGVSAATSAVALIQWRTAVRTLRGRLALVIPAVFVGTLALLLRRVSADGATDIFARRGDLLFGAGLVFGQYTLLPFTVNQFASDRAGLTLQWLSPIPARALVMGKALGLGLVWLMSGTLSLGLALLLAPTGSPLLWTAAALGGAGAFVLAAPLAALLSMLFPIAADLGAAGSGGNPHSVAMIAGLVQGLAVSAPPALVLLVARPATALVLNLAWLVAASATGVSLLHLVARVLDGRRENLALVAQGR